MDFSTLTLHMSASVQDLKILNTIPNPNKFLIITYYNHHKDLKLVENCKKRYISSNSQCEMFNCDF